MLDPLSWDDGRVARASGATLVWSLVAPGKIQNTLARKFPTDLNQTAERYQENTLPEDQHLLTEIPVQMPMDIS